MSLYTSLIQSIMLLHQECLVPLLSGLRRMEAMQTRILRAMAGCPRHITHKPNAVLREELGVFSVETEQLVRRLLFLRSILRGQESTLGSRGVLFGALPGERNGPLAGGTLSPLLRQFALDIHTWQLGPGSQILYEASPQIFGGGLLISPEDLRMLATAEPASI